MRQNAGVGKVLVRVVSHDLLNSSAKQEPQVRRWTFALAQSAFVLFASQGASLTQPEAFNPKRWRSYAWLPGEEEDCLDREAALRALSLDKYLILVLFTSLIKKRDVSLAYLLPIRGVSSNERKVCNRYLVK